MKTMRRGVLLVALLAGLTSGGCAGDPSSPQPLGEPSRLGPLAEVLADGRTPPQEKRRAAGELLLLEDATGDELLCQVLGSDDRAARVAVAEAIAHTGTDRECFIGPLGAMLSSQDPLQEAAAGRALQASRSPGALEKLLTVAGDPAASPSARLAAISGLQRRSDQRVVDRLISLLDDLDAAVASAAADSLAKITGIRTFGNDRAQWFRWWDENKDKDRLDWLADLAEGLALAKAKLEAENARLTERLSQAMAELYLALPAEKREETLLGLLDDPAGGIRAVGLAMVDRLVGANEMISPQVRRRVRAMLEEDEPALRREAALLLAKLADADSLEALLGRLGRETIPRVREALLTALGQLRAKEALPAILQDVQSQHEGVSAAAAVAMARIVAKNGSPRQGRAALAEVLIARYRASQDASGSISLREALLSAMGAVGDLSAVEVLLDALQDHEARIRLAAVNGLAQLNATTSTPALAPLTGDPDRGVRQAAIVALGSLGGQEYLSDILRRTDPTYEKDAGVRQEAWNTVMKILPATNVELIEAVGQSLARRGDALEQRIHVLQLLAAKLKARESSHLPHALVDLAEALLEADRAAEAASHLAEAYPLLLMAEDPAAQGAWFLWVEAMLLADDPACAGVIAQQDNEDAFDWAVASLEARLGRLSERSGYLGLIPLAEEALGQLSNRLDATQRQEIQETLAAARAGQLSADREQVAGLLPRLTADDPAGRQEAMQQLSDMSSRAVRPLLEEIKSDITSEQPNAALEKAIVDALRQIAPRLSGYDPEAPLADKLSQVDAWLGALPG